MTQERTYVLEELLTHDGDELQLPDGGLWYVSPQCCDCGEDDGIRYDNMYRPTKGLPVTCESCGTDNFFR